MDGARFEVKESHIFWGVSGLPSTDMDGVGGGLLPLQEGQGKDDSLVARVSETYTEGTSLES